MEYSFSQQHEYTAFLDCRTSYGIVEYGLRLRIQQMQANNFRSLVWFVVIDNENNQTESIHIFSPNKISDENQLINFVNNFCLNRNLTLIEEGTPIIHSRFPPRILRNQSRLPLGEFDCLTCNQACLLQGIWLESSSLPDEFQFCSDHCRRNHDQN